VSQLAIEIDLDVPGCHDALEPLVEVRLLLQLLRRSAQVCIADVVDCRLAVHEYGPATSFHCWNIGMNGDEDSELD
jgi:hypothetical protein